MHTCTPTPKRWVARHAQTHRRTDAQTHEEVGRAPQEKLLATKTMQSKQINQTNVHPPTYTRHQRATHACFGEWLSQRNDWYVALCRVSLVRPSRRCGVMTCGNGSPVPTVLAMPPTTRLSGQHLSRVALVSVAQPSLGRIKLRVCECVCERQTPYSTLPTHRTQTLGPKHGRNQHQADVSTGEHVPLTTKGDKLLSNGDTQRSLSLSLSL